MWCLAEQGWIATRPNIEVSMKQGIHPKYEQVTASCSCGNVIKINSTVGHDLNLDVCGECHPFYTGKQRDVASGGRVDRFNKRFSVPGAKK
ncbi:ribosomal protein L31 [Yersinia pestis biovar Orientalis str. MG05-1020]|nr:50S ribosomal subunit protein L31 [Yersinia pestis KIM10+]EDR34550.1 ribosomal protein L31 [Yersinia pestis biovar Orientalis str. IP275]EDR59267.1 ribosomal protein L31 [Yersinia pestis biovar Orientalis str. MG05-1020]